MDRVADTQSSEPTKSGREDRHRLREMRAPWAIVARRAGVLRARLDRASASASPMGDRHYGRFLEAHRTAAMLALLAAHEPPPDGWTRG